MILANAAMTSNLLRPNETIDVVYPPRENLMAKMLRKIAIRQAVR
jgi:hypothetical protein